MTLRLSSQQLAEYERDGILFPIPVLSPDESATFRHSLESFENKYFEGRMTRADKLHLFFDWAYRLATHDAIVDAVEDLLGPDILIDGTVIFCKPPYDESYVSWHQDSVYSGWHKTPSTSAWIALSASHRANGCMRVVPGSHKDGLIDHVNIEDDANLLKRGEQIEIDVDESRAADVILRPGEMSLHQSNIIHGSNPNKSDEKRIGFIVRYITNQVEPRDRPVLRVRGNADCSHLKLAKPPSRDEQEAEAAWLAQL